MIGQREAVVTDLVSRPGDTDGVGGADFTVDLLGASINTATDIIYA